MLYKKLHGETLTEKQIQNLSKRDWILQHAAHVYKIKTNVVAALEINVNGKLQRVVVKNFGWRNKISQILSPVMRSRAKKSWDAATLLLKNGVRVPYPISVFTFRKFGFIKTNSYLCENITDFRSARQILKDKSVETELKNSLIKLIAKMIAKLHTTKSTHNDLTLGNFLVKDIKKGEVYLIDLNRLVHRFRLSIPRRMYDISKINLCNCNLEKIHDDCRWLLFLKHYNPDGYSQNILALKKAIRRNVLRKNVKSLRKKGRRSH